MLAESETKKRGDSVHFVICKECFWCASLFGIRSLDACPSCSEKAIEFMPISCNERYNFSYSVDTGVVLEFSVDHNRKALAT
jgi:hypothetical protein